MNASTSLPDGLLLSWYGDDFTGAAAVMEVLSFAGLPAVLFLGVPRQEHLARFQGIRGIGIAGISRSKPPQWMDANLPEIFRTMAAFDAPINHYKICSTLDSAPHVGSIGRAADLAAPILGGRWHPFLVAAPDMARYQAFGNLFAGAGDRVHRLDRHPVMSRHPVTPMDESDVLRHLARQTGMTMGLISIADLAADPDAALTRLLVEGASLIAFDCVDRRQLCEIGRLIWERRGERLLAIGSQGLQYALVAYWRSRGYLADATGPAHPGAIDRMAVISGSCSPINGGQLTHAFTRGFSAIRIDPTQAIDEQAWSREIERTAAEAVRCISLGADPIVYTTTGPDDPANRRFLEAIDRSGRTAESVNEALGAGLGRLLDGIIRRTGIRRAAIAGGDTSSHAASALGIHALTALAPIATGAALCLAYSDKEHLDGFEIALKGGQMGKPDYFEQVRNGGIAA